MKPKPYKINGNHDVSSCVFKLFYGKYYVIVKAKTQIVTLTTIENLLAAYIRGGNEPNEEGMYYHLLMFVKRHPKRKFKVVSLMSNLSDQYANKMYLDWVGVKNNKPSEFIAPPIYSGYELLKFEQEELDKCRKDKYCLNNNAEAYIPDFNQDTEMYGWISQGDALNFRNWVKRKKGSIIS